MADLVPIDFVEELCRIMIANPGKALSEMAGKIEIGLFEGEAQCGNVIDRVFHRGNATPEIPADRQFAKLDATGFHTLEIEPRMFLLIPERLKNAFAERRWSFWKPQQ